MPRFRANRLTIGDAVIVLAWAAVTCGVAGLIDRSPSLVSATAVLSGCTFVLHDIRSLDQRAIEPITLFALGFAVTGVANLAAVASIQRLGELSPYALYVRVDYLYLATCLHLAGGIATIVGYRVVGSWTPIRVVGSILPDVAVRSNARSIAIGGTILAIVGLASTVIPVSKKFGTIAGLIGLTPAIVIFVFARFGAARKRRGFLITAVTIAILDASQAALFAYLRSEILIPIIALLLGTVLGSQTLRALRAKYLMPAYAGIAFFLVYFGALGTARRASGEQRILAIEQGAQAAAQPDTPRKATLMARLSNVNQLSEIGGLVESDGYLQGETLSYLAFAFIPRILWPEKPSIAKGQWFAFKIGQAMPRPDGSYSNSVNMTVPGELYLNYGWLGVTLGCMVFGAILAVFWSKSRFWSDADNALGTAYGFYLLWVGLGLGADVQIIVTITATYIVFVALRAAALILPGSVPYFPPRAATVRQSEPVATA